MHKIKQGRDSSLLLQPNFSLGVGVIQGTARGTVVIACEDGLFYLATFKHKVVLANLHNLNLWQVGAVVGKYHTLLNLLGYILHRIWRNSVTTRIASDSTALDLADAPLWSIAHWLLLF